MKKYIPYISSLILAGFGLLTLFLSSSVIFDWFGIRAKEGNYVLLVVWANFISSLLYLISAYGFMKIKSWTFKTLLVATVILIVALIGLFIHIYSGGIYETKTVFAMLFRISVTIVFTAIAYLSINKKK
ncbi:MAG: hypothetical protein LCH44_04630 [Bacteroidetes bacterium]|jgi:hypothetical protein|nr:hypothetical protein [Bacteroidota bacterium]MCO5277688.1 hypothetical protein [Saprospiraceae bacterium]